MWNSSHGFVTCLHSFHGYATGAPGLFVDHACGSGNETGDHTCSFHAISGMHRGLESLRSSSSLYLTAKQLSPLTFIDSVNVSATLHCHSEKVATLSQGGTPR